MCAIQTTCTARITHEAEPSHVCMMASCVCMLQLMHAAIDVTHIYYEVIFELYCTYLTSTYPTRSSLILYHSRTKPKSCAVRRHHWIVATTLNCQLGEIRVCDSLFQYCDKETEHTIANLFQLGLNKLKITVAQSQKRREGLTVVSLP